MYFITQILIFFLLHFARTLVNLEKAKMDQSITVVGVVREAKSFAAQHAHSSSATNAFAIISLRPTSKRLRAMMTGRASFATRIL